MRNALTKLRIFFTEKFLPWYVLCKKNNRIPCIAYTKPNQCNTLHKFNWFHEIRKKIVDSTENKRAFAVHSEKKNNFKAIFAMNFYILCHIFRENIRQCYYCLFHFIYLRYLHVFFLLSQIDRMFLCKRHIHDVASTIM